MSDPHTPILQSHLPFAPWMDARTHRLPGILPVEGDDWLRVDDAFAGQMGERDRLLREVPDRVHAMLPPAEPAAQELLALVLDRLARTPGYVVGASAVTRPDGVTVPRKGPPLMQLGHLVQEDLCLMERAGDEHCLTGAVLCFPASWSLAEKLGRPMTGIHTPVTPYTEDVARRVQRLFDAVRPEQPLWRMNALTYADPTLHQPRTEAARRPRPKAEERRFMRCERQCLVRLPVSRAVVFAIHTYVVRLQDLSQAERDGLADAGL